MFWKTFYNLCKSNNTTPNAVCCKLGLSTATATGWKKRGVSPSGDILLQISKCFNVSVDYLLTGQECSCICKKTKNLLTVREHTLIDDFRELNKEGQDKCLSLIDDIVKCGKYKRGTKSNEGGPNITDIKHVG